MCTHKSRTIRPPPWLRLALSGRGILLGIPAFIMLVLLVALCFLLQNSHDAAFAALPRAYGASAFILPLVALYPPSWSAAFFTPLLRCAGACVVRA